MTDLADFTRLADRDRNLCTVSTLRGDGTIQSTLVNAGVLKHPLTGADVVGTVVFGASRKLVNLRAHPRMTVLARASWNWAAVEGPVWIAGPDDPAAGVDPERLRLLLREVFAAAGGTHDDWDEYDRVMAAERRTVLLVTPERVYGNS
ncbi:pyridoxamine 5'-phosphate oxidase [Nocardia sp. alder85J]|uniref:pyridoxamine 5'-phosphate oxidase n=1 Tax=Nocardia sp. alder85J TaxID=2862949 RepID=UPI001CD2E4F5|nr:pyridoxamine 5'-phosphate oxidase [Nocardia sp. alder85J]MCX4091330.1 pyridoxamine 5'-phosphate oxidase [Nocardia sp. alder85J]